jgi:hypothetical protein
VPNSSPGLTKESRRLSFRLDALQHFAAFVKESFRWRKDPLRGKRVDGDCVTGTSTAVASASMVFSGDSARPPARQLDKPMPASRWMRQSFFNNADSRVIVTLIGIIALAAGIFIFDIVTPIEVSASIFYARQASCSSELLARC